MTVFKGTATALITPLKDNEVDFASLERLLDWQLAGEIDALAVNCTTGEPSTLSRGEKKDAARFAIKKINGRVPVVLGAGSNDTYTAAEYAREAEELGADAVLLVTPYYNKTTQSGLVAHYKKIADNIGIPMILYNVPARTGLNMRPETVAALAGYRNITAVKEASGSAAQMQKIKSLCGDSIDLYSGDDGLAFSCMAVGGIGAISVASNIIPKFFSDMIGDCLKGDFAKARMKQEKMLSLIDALFCEVNPIPVKTAAYWMGLIDSDYMRLPLVKMEKTEILEKAMAEFGLSFEVKK